jgi:hypothetical protein
MNIYPASTPYRPGDYAVPEFHFCPVDMARHQIVSRRRTDSHDKNGTKMSQKAEFCLPLQLDEPFFAGSSFLQGGIECRVRWRIIMARAGGRAQQRKESASARMPPTLSHISSLGHDGRANLWVCSCRRIRIHLGDHALCTGFFFVPWPPSPSFLQSCFASQTPRVGCCRESSIDRKYGVQVCA